MKKWHFGEKNDELVNLVLSGKKTATTSVYEEGAYDNILEESILTFENEKEACITKLIDLKIMKFKDVPWNLAKLEGENDNLEDWRNVHRKFFMQYYPDFNDDVIVAIEIFEVVKVL